LLAAAVVVVQQQPVQLQAVVEQVALKIQQEQTRQLTQAAAAVVLDK
jgi:hypothetical protein